jgi:microcystin-dependent protein
MYAGAAEPSGYLLCNGASYPTATYPQLFAAIGYAFGGSGANFNVPDLRGRFPIGTDPTHALAGTGGEATHVLTRAEMPTHNHASPTQNETQKHSHGGTGGNFINLGTGGAWVSGSGVWQVNNQGVTALNSIAHNHAINNDGSDAAHNNMPPYQSLNFIIKT